MFKVNSEDNRTVPVESSGVFIVNFEHISHLVLVFLLLTLNMQLPIGKQTITRGVVRTLSNIYDGDSCKNSWWRKAVNCHKKLQIFDRVLNTPRLTYRKPVIYRIARTEVYLEPNLTSTMELFCENS